jgi:sporulation protein YlmC with PRC-barrel domain
MLKTLSRALVVSIAAALAAAPALGAQARQFIGQAVHDEGGARVGEVHDLILDVNEARVLYVIIQSQERYHTLPIRALDETLRLDSELAGSIAHSQAFDESRFRRAARLLGTPVSQADGPQLGTIRDFRFDPASGQIDNVLVDTVAGVRDLPASVLAQRELPAPAAAGAARAPEPDASSGFSVVPSPDRKRLHNPAR